MNDKSRDNNAILIVDDEPLILSALQRALEETSFDLTGASGGEEALDLMEKKRFKVVISDERMPRMGGAEFLAQVKERFPETVRMMLTGHASVEAAMRAVNSGEIYRFFIKPWDDTELQFALKSAVEKYDLEEENRRLLKTVKRQSRELKLLEDQYPGISDLNRGSDGAIDIEISDDDLREIIAACNEA